MRAQEKDELLARRVEQDTGSWIGLIDANRLRRAALTLHRWDEGRCGDSGPYFSWAIERDEETGKPYRGIYPYEGKNRKVPIPDREAGAERRIAEICKEHGMFWYHQSDPRGCSLYVSKEELTDSNYNRGVAVY